MSDLRIWSALTCLLFCTLAAGQEVDSDFATTDGEADGFSPDARPFEYSAEVESLIREAGCSDEDEQCKQAVAVRYALRLPEGFSREPDCVANTVCVSEMQTIAHDDFVAILELVSPRIQPDWVNITMREVMMGIVLVTAESDLGHAATFDFINGAEFLVEKKPPMIGNWSILRGQVYQKDLRR